MIRLSALAPRSSAIAERRPRRSRMGAFAPPPSQRQLTGCAGQENNAGDDPVRKMEPSKGLWLLQAALRGLMKSIQNVGLRQVQAVYSGPEGALWELIMGEQIHMGGLQSSIDLANKAGIGAGLHGIDLCCCSGAGMRFLVKLRNVSTMRGVDATPTVVERGRQRCQTETLDPQISFALADVCESGLPSQSADFVWGEDAWCYVVDKPKLIAEAARLVKPGGVIAFTDWLEGPASLSEAEAGRFLSFMKFPNLLNMEEYQSEVK